MRTRWACLVVAAAVAAPGCAGGSSGADATYTRTATEPCLKEHDTGATGATNEEVPGGLATALFRNGVMAEAAFFDSKEAAEAWSERDPRPGERRVYGNVAVYLYQSAVGRPGPDDEDFERVEDCLA